MFVLHSLQLHKVNAFVVPVVMVTIIDFCLNWYYTVSYVVAPHLCCYFNVIQNERIPCLALRLGYTLRHNYFTFIINSCLENVQEIYGIMISAPTLSPIPQSIY